MSGKTLNFTLAIRKYKLNIDKMIQNVFASGPISIVSVSLQLLVHCTAPQASAAFLHNHFRKIISGEGELNAVVITFITPLAGNRMSWGNLIWEHRG